MADLVEVIHAGLPALVYCSTPTVFWPETDELIEIGLVEAGDDRYPQAIAAKSFSLFKATCRTEVRIEDSGASAALVEAKLVGVATLTGSCSEIIIPPSVGTSGRCSGKLLNTNYSDGRSGFYFVAEHSTVTFSGPGSKQVKENADRSVQPIDGVIFTANGETITLNAVGACLFENPYGGPSPVHCQAITEEGRFEAFFVSDGREPNISRF